MNKSEHLIENVVACIENGTFESLGYNDILTKIKNDPNFPPLEGAAADELAKSLYDMGNWVVYTYKPSLDI